ncbi:uncharacterized protein LOC107626802 [Arachis ipaensis]|uniref:uncharacterized protein LOC107626802 n=1 Tax=Arachis ipaensis TaxID=130454 RepID=UPI0007AF053D|nr:uncharacterized protein LOC107626802 [Arachis ipaensis]
MTQGKDDVVRLRAFLQQLSRDPIVLTIALSRAWTIKQLDVNNAFLHGDLAKDVYMKKPRGYDIGDGNLVCKLTKALYGLKQAPKAWHDSTTMVLVYVDDIIITGSSNKVIGEIIQQLNIKFALKDMVKFSAFRGSAFNNPKFYQCVMGSLQYFTVTKPELAYCVSKISQFMLQLLDEHWTHVKHILRYVCGTSTFGLLLQPTNITTMEAYSDSDWGGDPDDQKSTGSFCVFLGKNLVSWCSKKQGAVARSSTETEYQATADLVAKLIWIKNLMIELQTELPTPPSIYCDNLSAVLLAVNPIYHSKSKQFEIDIHFVCDFVTKRIIDVSHVLGTV